MNEPLSPLQIRILRALSGIEPPWTLTGGGALALAHTHHRATRDLDLFWHGRRDLPEPRLVERRLEDAGLGVERLQTSPAFVQLRVTNGDAVTTVDLVADPVPVVDPPVEWLVDGSLIHIDTAREIMANKLGALLSRSEFRDLVDVEVLLEAGQDLEEGLAGAAAKDSGFSVAVLAWVLKDMPVRALGRAAGASAEQIDGVRTFRDTLVARLVALARPSTDPE